MAAELYLIFLTELLVTLKAVLFPYRPLTLNSIQIKYAATYKFLGMIFDKKLTWKPHIQKLHARTQNDLRLLQIIAHCKWGADYISLRRIYLSLLRPKIEYGDFLYATAAPTNLKILIRIQYAAARTIIGALKSTPVNTLEAEANLMPLGNQLMQAEF